MPSTPGESKHSAKKYDRWSVRATNATSGGWWAIDDTRAVCEKDLATKLDEWGVTEDDPAIIVEWHEHTEA